MPSPIGGVKFYLAAVWVGMAMARADIHNSPFPAAVHDEISWGLHIALGAVGFLLSPELLDIAKGYISKLAGSKAEGVQQ